MKETPKNLITITFLAKDYEKVGEKASQSGMSIRQYCVKEVCKAANITYTYRHGNQKYSDAEEREQAIRSNREKRTALINSLLADYRNQQKKQAEQALQSWIDLQARIKAAESA